MKKTLVMFFVFFVGSSFLFAQEELNQEELTIDYSKISKVIRNPNSPFYYPSLLKRYNEFDKTLTLEDYSYIYYGFSYQEDYLVNRPSEKYLPELFEKKEYEQLIQLCEIILKKNPVSLLANNYMGYSLYKLNYPESEWRKYQNRYRELRKVIVYSGNGLTCETGFKVIYVSDEENIIHDYFEIETVNQQTQQGLCKVYGVESSEYFRFNKIYFDVTRRLLKEREVYLKLQKQLNDLASKQENE